MVVLTNIVAALAKRGFSVKAEKMNVFAKEFNLFGASEHTDWT